MKPRLRSVEVDTRLIEEAACISVALVGRGKSEGRVRFYALITVTGLSFVRFQKNQLENVSREAKCLEALAKQFNQYSNEEVCHCRAFRRAIPIGTKAVMTGQPMRQ